MFDHICPACNKRQLIFPSQVTSVVNSDQGIEVSYTCWCGSSQTWVTGRAVTEKAQVAAAA
ncbi:hypothetical protein [Nocardioides mesophilus]|uniref:Uncharacterized protein n=1 Tax=Nocardioides mesophilus TaxID=433659 RepID=A0A7G9RGG1_9ACTN|nr:hypothetical protein [Nocardioides mesophilus]QNN54686.1 hypothetical protein H9L09_10515 [Nocardioides mesophilus]